jgi:hypothetical protein
MPNNINSRRLKISGNTKNPIRTSLSSCSSSFSKHKPIIEDSENSKLASNWGARKTWDTKENSTVHASCAIIKAKGRFALGMESEDSENIISEKLRKTWFSKENGGSGNSHTIIEVSRMPRNTNLEMEMEGEARDESVYNLQESVKARRFRSPITRISQSKEPR